MAGHGIHDMWDAEAQQNINGVSKYAWVETLGKYLDLPVVNCAIPGTSNKEIAHCIHNFDFRPDDRVIVQWTFRERSCIIGVPDENGNNYKISVHGKEEISTHWTEYHADYNNMIFESVMAISSARWILEQNQVLNRHLFLKNFDWENQTQVRDHLNKDIIPLPFDWSAGNKGYDDEHPDLESYTVYAHTIYEWMKQNEDLNQWQ